MYTLTRWKVQLVLRVCVILGDSTCAGDQKAVWLLRRSPVDRIPVHTLGFVYFGKVLGLLGPTSAAALCPETSDVFRLILAFRTACPWIWRYCDLPKRRAVEPQQHTVDPRRLGYSRLFVEVCSFSGRSWFRWFFYVSEHTTWPPKIPPLFWYVLSVIGLEIGHFSRRV